MSKFEFEPIERTSVYREIKHASIDARNRARENRRDELIREYGYIPAQLQDAIENYNGEWRSAPLEPCSFNGKKAKLHYEIRQKPVKLSAIQKWENAWK